MVYTPKIYLLMPIRGCMVVSCCKCWEGKTWKGKWTLGHHWRSLSVLLPHREYILRILTCVWKGYRLVPKPLRVYIPCNIGFRLCYVSPSNINTKGFLSSLASPALSETMQHWAGWVGVQGSIQSALSCCSSGLRGSPASLRTEGSTSVPWMPWPGFNPYIRLTTGWNILTYSIIMASSFILLTQILALSHLLQ